MAALTLDDVREAIRKVAQSGQAYTANGVTYTRANLSDLLKIEAELEAVNGVDGLGRHMTARGRIVR